LVGNHPVLDFVNTVENRLRPAPEEDLIASYEDFLRWLSVVGLLGNDELARLREECAFREEACRAALREARSLREAFWAIFGAIAHGGTPPEGAVGVLNRILSQGSWTRRVHIDEDSRPSVEYERRVDALMKPVLALAESGADLLASEKLDRIRMCDREECGDLFYDASKPGRRRWCDMAKCGNRTKVNRYRSRHGA
jgi:predicted RNA-binding Zn ribbon-like protein